MEGDDALQALSSITRYMSVSSPLTEVVNAG